MTDDDETQPPDHEMPLEVQETTTSSRKRGRGTAKGTLFEKLRKRGRIAVKVPTGARGPIGDNERVFKERVTYLVRHFVNVQYKCWSQVPKQDKEELYTRILGDFELNWGRHEDQTCIKARLAYSFRTYKYYLHKRYKSWAIKEEALAHPPEEVDISSWVKCCVLWASEAYADRMKLLYAEQDPTESSREIAEQVFRNVLGSKPGYMRGLGNSVIPEQVSPSARSYHVTRLTQEVEMYKSEQETYKNKYDTLQNQMNAMMVQLASFGDKMDHLYPERSSDEERDDETLP